MNSYDHSVTMMGMTCDSRTYERMSPDIIDRVHADIRREVQQFVDQLKYNNMEELIQKIKNVVPQTP